MHEICLILKQPKIPSKCLFIHYKKIHLMGSFPIHKKILLISLDIIHTWNSSNQSGQIHPSMSISSIDMNWFESWFLHEKSYVVNQFHTIIHSDHDLSCYSHIIQCI
jgi:hypothetical protein